MNLFLAHRFNEFAGLKSKLKEVMENPLSKGLKIKLIDLDDGKATIQNALDRSLETLRNEVGIMILLVGDSYSDNLPDGEHSITHLEFREALKPDNSIELLVYYIGKYSMNKNFLSEDESDNLKKFKREVFPKHGTNYIYRGYDSEVEDEDKLIENISSDIGEACHKINNRKDSDSINDQTSDIFNLVALVNSFNKESIEFSDFVFKTPLSLVEKIYPAEYLELKSTITGRNNRVGIFVDGNNHDNYFIELNDFGRELALTNVIEDEHSIISQILIHCAPIGYEHELFTQFTLKSKFFHSLFKSFEHNLDFLVNESNKIYPSPLKNVLFYRLLGEYYYEKGAIELMRKNYQRCIDLLEKDASNDRTSFYLFWVEKEIKLGEIDQAKTILEDVIDKYDRRNTSARFFLSAIYRSENLSAKAIDLFKDIVNDDGISRPFYQTEKIWNKLQRAIGSIRRIQHNLGIQLQLVFKDLAIDLSRNGQEAEGAELLANFNKNIENNITLKKVLVRHYIEQDLDEAEKQIRILEDRNFDQYHIAELKFHYFRVKHSPAHAYSYIRNFLREYPTTENIDFIFKSIGQSYSSQKNYTEAVKTFEKISPKNRDSYILYAIALSRTKNDKALPVFRNYFKAIKYYDNFRNFTKYINQYVKHCIDSNKLLEARKLIAWYFKERKALDLSDEFLCFLWQKQLSLTSDYSRFDDLMRTSLGFAVDRRQKAIVYSVFGSDTISKRQARQRNKSLIISPNKSLSPLETVTFEKAERLLFSSLILIDDAGVRIKRAQCLYFLERFDEATTELQTILNKNKIHKRSLYHAHLELAKNYIKLEDVNQARANLERIRHTQLYPIGHYELAISMLQSEEETIESFEIATQEKYRPFRKLDHAIYLYSIGKTDKSQRIIKGLNKFSNSKFLKEINSSYHKAISDFKPAISFKEIAAIENAHKSFFQTKKRDTVFEELFTSLNDTYPFEETIISYKFNYYFQLKNYRECELILNELSLIGLFNKKTAPNFYTLGLAYYNNANSNFGTTRSRLQKIKKASEYIETAIHSDEENLKYLELYCRILYKVGDATRFKLLKEEIVSKLDSNSSSTFLSSLYKNLRNVKILLWPEFIDSYYSKIEFYRYQEKQAAILLSNDEVYDKISLLIYKSIESDTQFHTKNEYIILRRIHTRLAHYYFTVAKKIQSNTKKMDSKEAIVEWNYEQAMMYQLLVRKQNQENEAFTGAMLATLQYLNQNSYGIKLCKEYLKKRKTAHLYHKYGNFLRQDNQLERALVKYHLALSLAESDKHKAIIYNNILTVIHDAIISQIVLNRDFGDYQNAKRLYGYIESLYPDFKYLDGSLKMLKKIKELSC